MTVSIVIPAYNEEKYISKTIESIKLLSLQPDEILVIDGGSTDSTKMIAEGLGARVVTVPHRGIGFARQRGLEEARGDIIAFTDSDSVVPKDWLKKIVHALEKPGVSCVFSEFWVPDGWWPYRFFINILQPIYIPFFHYLFRISLAPGQNTAFWKKKAIEAGGYPVDFKIAEDLEMAKRLSKVGKVIYLFDNFVVSSGRRGNEGLPLIRRIFMAYWYYATTKRADVIGFPDMR